MPTPSSNSTGDGYDIPFKILLGAIGVAVPLSNLAWLGGNITAWSFNAGSWAPYQPTDALLRRNQLWPEAGHTALLIGALIVPSLIVITLAMLGAVWWTRRRGGDSRKRVVGMAKQKDIEPLLVKALRGPNRSL